MTMTTTMGQDESNGISSAAGHQVSHRHGGRSHGAARGQGGQLGEVMGTPLNGWAVCSAPKEKKESFNQPPQRVTYEPASA